MNKVIADDLYYRIYGDELAIIINMKTGKVVLLQDEALKEWQEVLSVDSSKRMLQDSHINKQFTNLGLLSNGEEQVVANIATSTDQPGWPDLDFGVINYWSFKNNVALSAHLELTGRCNLRCQHCYCLFENKKDSLSTTQVCKIIDDLAESGTFGLVLTGGEVFARNDIVDILNHLAKRGFILRINTNATLLNEKIIAQLATYSNIYRIHVSLYSADPPIHDQITGVKGSFHKTLNSLQMMKKVGVKLRINCSVMRANFSSYKQVKTEIGDKLGIPVRFDSQIFPKDDGSHTNMVNQLNGPQLKQFFADKEQQTQKENSKKQPRKPKLCKAGKSFFCISENGDVYPCLKMRKFYQKPLGNLVSQTMAEIWHGSPKILEIREHLDQKLRDCHICDLAI